MARYLIESAKCEIAGDVLCPAVVAEAKLCPEEGEPFYLSLAEVEGIAQFYRSAESTFELQIHPADCEETGRIPEKDLLWAGEYDELFDENDPVWLPLYRYLIYIVRSAWEDCNAFIAATEGHYLDEISVPVSDVEDLYYEEC